MQGGLSLGGIAYHKQGSSGSGERNTMVEFLQAR